jgi:hypothetical protein
MWPEYCHLVLISPIFHEHVCLSDVTITIFEEIKWC